MLNISQIPSFYLFGFTACLEITEIHFPSLDSALDQHSGGRWASVEQCPTLVKGQNGVFIGMFYGCLLTAFCFFQHLHVNLTHTCHLYNMWKGLGSLLAEENCPLPSSKPDKHFVQGWMGSFPKVAVDYKTVVEYVSSFWTYTYHTFFLYFFFSTEESANYFNLYLLF